VCKATAHEDNLTTSFPEKTFEHWASQYIAYRFRTHLGQWWPAVGADIKIEPTMLPIGKAIWLELKTATPHPRSPDIHEVFIDVPQLLAYHQPSMPPVYYVVPRPGWSGTLGTAAAAGWLAGTPRSDLAFRRANEKWFGNWTRVIAGWSLHAAIQRNGRAGQATAKLGQWDQNVWTWAPAFIKPVGTYHPEWTWPDFWNEWQRCGSTDMPSSLIVPADSLTQSGDGRIADRSDLVGALRTYGKMVREGKKPGTEDFAARSIYEPVFAPMEEGGLPTGKFRFQRSVKGAETNTIDSSPDSGLAAGSTLLTTLSARQLILP